MYSICLELPILGVRVGRRGGKRCQVWLKSFIRRKILLYKRSRTRKSFFLYIPRPPTTQSLKHSFPKEGDHSTPVFISSSGLQTSPTCFSSATHDCCPRVWCPHHKYCVRAEQSYGRANSIDYLTTDTLVRQLQIKRVSLHLKETKQIRSKRQNKAPRHQKRKGFQVTTTDFVF